MSLTDVNDRVQCEVLFLVANMTAGEEYYRELVSRDAALVNELRRALVSGTRDVTREAMYCAAHLTLSGTHVTRVIDRAVVQHVISVLTTASDSESQVLALTLLEIAARYIDQGRAWLHEAQLTAHLAQLTAHSEEVSRACALFGATYLLTPHQ